AWSGGGTVTESGADDRTYGYTTDYLVSGSATGANWSWADVGSGTGGADGSGFANWSVRSSGAYSYAASDVGDGEGTVSGAYGASASANSKYDFATTAQQDCSGAWGETGTGRRTRSGGTHDSYSGSGTYSESGDGWGTWSG